MSPGHIKQFFKWRNTLVSTWAVSKTATLYRVKYLAKRGHTVFFEVTFLWSLLVTTRFIGLIMEGELERSDFGTWFIFTNPPSFFPCVEDMAGPGAIPIGLAALLIMSLATTVSATTVLGMALIIRVSIALFAIKLCGLIYINWLMKCQYLYEVELLPKFLLWLWELFSIVMCATLFAFYRHYVRSETWSSSKVHIISLFWPTSILLFIAFIFLPLSIYHVPVSVSLRLTEWGDIAAEPVQAWKRSTFVLKAKEVLAYSMDPPLPTISISWTGEGFEHPMERKIKVYAGAPRSNGGDATELLTPATLSEWQKQRGWKLVDDKGEVVYDGEAPSDRHITISGYIENVLTKAHKQVDSLLDFSVHSDVPATFRLVRRKAPIGEEPASWGYITEVGSNADTIEARGVNGIEWLINGHTIQLDQPGEAYVVWSGQASNITLTESRSRFLDFKDGVYQGEKTVRNAGGGVISLDTGQDNVNTAISAHLPLPRDRHGFLYRFEWVSCLDCKLFLNEGVRALMIKRSAGELRIKGNKVNSSSLDDIVLLGGKRLHISSDEDGDIKISGRSDIVLSNGEPLTNSLWNVLPVQIQALVIGGVMTGVAVMFRILRRRWRDVIEVDTPSARI
jgi:hypothetical protein